MGIERIQKVNIGEQVFTQMKQMILEGEWKSGDKLPSEGDLSDLFGVSRITVRQALQKLNVMGLIETRLGSGSYVKSADVGNSMQELIPSVYLTGSLNQVMDFREIVEVGSARLAAKCASEEDIRKLQSILDEMRYVKDDEDIKKFAELDATFHFEIGNITQNALVIKTNEILHDVLENAMNQFISRMGFEPALKYHKKLIEAIAAHDEEAAAQLMHDHLQENYSVTLDN